MPRDFIVGVRTGGAGRGLRTPLVMAQAAFTGAVHVTLLISVAHTGVGCAVCRNRRPEGVTTERHVVEVNVTEEHGVQLLYDTMPYGPDWKFWAVAIDTTAYNRLIRAMNAANGKPYNFGAWLNAVPGASWLGLSRGLGHRRDGRSLEPSDLRQCKAFFCSELVAAVLKVFLQAAEDDAVMPAPRDCWPSDVHKQMVRLSKEAYKKNRGARPIVASVPVPTEPLHDDNWPNYCARLRDLFLHGSAA